MAEEPIIQNDSYTLKQEDYIRDSTLKINLLRSFKKQQKNDLKPISFRFTDSKQDRIEKGKEEGKIFDHVPNANINFTFSKVLRNRNRQLEIGPEFRFKPKNRVERVFDELKNRDQLYLRSSDITSLHTEIGSNLHKSFDQQNAISRQDKVGRSLDRVTFSDFYSKYPKEMLPSFHKKTHFKAMESMCNNEPGVLNIEDGSIDPILQDLNLTSPQNQFNQTGSFFNSQGENGQFGNTHYSLSTRSNQYFINNNGMLQKKKFIPFSQACNSGLSDQNSILSKSFVGVRARGALDYQQVSGFTKQILQRCNVVRRKNLNLIQNSKDLCDEVVKIT